MAASFSIIIPAYNAVGFLRRAVDSALAQAWEEVEIIIVDDGSTDGTPAMAADYQTQHPDRVRFVEQTNQGPGAARNHGISKAQGDFILCLDADDELVPEALGLFAEKIAQVPEVEMVFAGYFSVSLDGDRKAYCPEPVAADPMRNFLNYIRGRGVTPTHGAVAIRRKVFDQLHYPESIRNNEDVVLFAQILATRVVASLPDPILLKYKRVGSLRYDQAAVAEASQRAAQLLFDANILPPAFIRHQAEFQSSRHLARFRTLYRDKRFAEARAQYHQAIKIYPRHLFRMNALAKYLRSLRRDKAN
ncbi:MAG: glycosyltransferase family 2 protein [Pseudomonadota bacterium]|nr:glycosyltransferase family 2 protein [Pseudomonadota bacterium]